MHAASATSVSSRFQSIPHDSTNMVVLTVSVALASFFDAVQKVDHLTVWVEKCLFAIYEYKKCSKSLSITFNNGFMLVFLCGLILESF